MKNLPERDTTKPTEQQGMFRKFEVHRVDGSDQLGGKWRWPSHGCRYFVLDLDHDQHAAAAMAAYAQACKETHPALSEELGAEYPLDPWMPIDTAPKDGTELDLWLIPCTGRCRRVAGAWWVSGGWRVNAGVLDRDMKFSHWMPTPQPPKGED